MAVSQDRQGAVEIITLNRPEVRNALDAPMIRGIVGALERAERDSTTLVVVITGAGDRAFCSGMDLKAFAAGVTTGDPDDMDRYYGFLRGGFPKPVIAAVNGAAVAGGFELMMACDLVVAAEHSVFGIPEVRRGLVAGGGGALLPLRLPMALALELGLTGGTFDSRRALDIGLVNRVVPSGSALEGAIELAGQIAQNAPLAVAATKNIMYHALAFGGARGWERLAELAPSVAASEDAVEGARAFVEKRPPRWAGR